MRLPLVSASIGGVLVQALLRQPCWDIIVIASLTPLEDAVSQQSSCSFGSHILSTPSAFVFFDPWGRSWVMDVTVRAEHYVITWSLHFDRLWFFVVLSVSCKKKVLWWGWAIWLDSGTGCTHFYFWGRVSCDPGLCYTHYVVAKADLEHLISLPLPLKCLDYKHVTPCLVHYFLLKTLFPCSHFILGWW